MACKHPALRGALPICEMSLRPISTQILPGQDHVVLIDPDRWIRHNHHEEECLCDTPHLEWCVSPLGAAVEICWGSANHHLCLPRDPRPFYLIPEAHPGIAAEAIFVGGDIAAFVSLVTADPRAAQHIVSLPRSFTDEGVLAEAQHCVRAALARVSALAAAKEHCGGAVHT